MPEQSSLTELLSKVVVVLPFEDKIEILLIGAVTRIIKMIRRF